MRVSVIKKCESKATDHTLTYTTAPVEFDDPKLGTLDWGTIGKHRSGKLIRLVSNPEMYADDQRALYADSNHMVFNDEEYKAFKDIVPIESYHQSLKI